MLAEPTVVVVGMVETSVSVDFNTRTPFELELTADAAASSADCRTASASAAWDTVDSQLVPSSVAHSDFGLE